MKRLVVLGITVSLTTWAAAAETDAEPGQPALEEVVVTATRREESLQRVPISVTALGGEFLRATGISDIDNLGQAVPGFTGIRDSGGFRPVVRGVGSSGVIVGDEQNVATYVDGIYQGGSVFSWLDFVEVERVEVLRGPQGTMFGRNATGGLINVITPTPKFDPGGRISLRYGTMTNDVDDYEAKLYATRGVSNSTAIDFAALYRQNGGFVENLVGPDDYGDQEALYLRSKALWQPSDNVRAIGTIDYINIDTQANVVEPYHDSIPRGAAFPGAVIPTQTLQASLDVVPESDYERFNVSAQVEFELPGARIESATAYSAVNVLQTSDSDATNILLGSNSFPGEVKTISEEIRVLSNDESNRLQWLAGLYLFDLDASMTLHVATGTGGSAPPSLLLVSPDIDAQSIAGFAEGTYALTEHWFATLGARYTWEERKFTQSINGARLPFGTAHKEFTEPTYRGILQYRFDEDRSAYVSYSTGFKSGVHNGVGTSPVPVEPEEIGSAEIGFKLEPRDWLRTNLSLFRYKYDNLQVTARSADLRYVLQNAASVTGTGGELEISAALGSHFQATLASSYVDSEYDAFPAAQSFIPSAAGGNVVAAMDVSGKQVIRAPEWTMSIALQTDFDAFGGVLEIGANAFRSTRVYFDALNLFSQEPYTLVNVEISWRPAPDSAIRLFADVRNLTDERVINFIRPSAFVTDVVYDQPRRIGAGFEFSF